MDVVDLRFSALDSVSLAGVADGKPLWQGKRRAWVLAMDIDAMSLIWRSPLHHINVMD